MVRAVVALRHLDRLPADRDPEELVAEADAEHRHPRVEQRPDGRNGVGAGLGRIARAVGQKDAVGLQRQNLLGRRRRRHHGDRAAAVVEQAQDVALHPVVDRDDMETRRAPPAVAALQRPARFVPVVALGRADLGNEVHAVDAGPAPRLGAQGVEVEGAVGRVGDDGVRHAGLANEGGQRAGVDPGHADHAARLQPGVEPPLSAEIGRVCRDRRGRPPRPPRWPRPG